MSAHKLTDKICAAVTVISIVLTLLFMNGEALGLQKITDEDAETYSGETVFTDNDLDGTWDTTPAAVITLEGDGGTVSGNGAYFLDGNLVIANAGYYVVSGELTDGYISVDTHDGAKVWIMLSGVNINCTDNACIRVEQADKAFLTLAEGTENTVSSGSEYSEEALADKTAGTIYSHDDLTVNGSGSLTVTAGYRHGIDVNDSLVITGGTICITSAADALHANDGIDITGANITINAGDDAIHCDTGIGIYGGTILAESCYEGMEAGQILIEDGDITIYPSDDGLNANGGSSSLEFGGMMGGWNVGRIGETAEAAGVSGGTPVEDTAVSEDAAGEEATEEAVAGAQEEAAAGAREEAAAGAQEEAAAEAQEEAAPGAQEEIVQEAAGVPEAAAESAKKEEAEEGELEEEELPVITINGGSLTILNENGRDADGIDSNGNIIINGGTILVSMENSGGNNGLDYGSENGGSCIINGGTVIVGSGSSMAEEISDASEQNNVMWFPEEEAAAGSRFAVYNTDGDEVISGELPYSASAVVLSSPELICGESYTLVFEEDGEEAQSTEVNFEEDTAVTVGNASFSAGMGNMMPADGQMLEMSADGQMPEMPAGGQMPEIPAGGQMPEMRADGQMPEMPADGEMPEMPEGGQILGMSANDQMAETSADSQISQILQMSDGSQISQLPEDEQAVEENGEDQSMQNGAANETTGRTAGENIDDENTNRAAGENEGTNVTENAAEEQYHSGAGPQETMMPGMSAEMQQDQAEDEVSESCLRYITEFGADTWILMLVSVVSLIAAVFFVRKYK